VVRAPSAAGNSSKKSISGCFLINSISNVYLQI
jgi:hypothetical protein